MTWGLYLAGQSPVHLAPAGVKLAVLILVGLGVLFLENMAALAAIAVVALLLFPAAGLPWRAVYRQLRVPLLFLGLIAVGHGVMTTWAAGATVVLRLGILVLLATLLVLTTRVSDMLSAFERALAPLRRWGIDSERVAFVLALTIRLIPLLASRADAVREAQRARGLDRSLIALVVPLLVRGLRTADALTEAIEARGGLGE